MKLYNGNLYWNHTMEATYQFDQVNESLNTKVLIVGGGMSGTLCAYVLASSGMDVTIVDRDRIGNGSSAANTGLLQYMSDKMLCDFAVDIGKEKAVLFYKMCLEAMNYLTFINTQLLEETEYKKKDSIYYASNNEDAKKLQKEYNYLKRYDFPVEFLTSQALENTYGISKPCAIRTWHDAEVNPYKFIQALTKENSKMGVRHYEMTEIDLNNIEENKVFTTNGFSITFDQLLLTTGYTKQFPFNIYYT